MHGKKSFLALSTAFAALFVGCEWTGTSESDSWSSAYDAMNFSGTYRIMTLTTLIEGNADASEHAADWLTDDDSGTFAANKTTASGRTSHQNIVPGSVKISCGNYVWTDNGGNGIQGEDQYNRVGSLIFGGGASSTSSSVAGKTATYTGTVKEESKYYNCKLTGGIVEGSVSVRIGSSGGGFKDNGDGTLTGINDIGTGFVNYLNGDVSLSFAKAVPVGTQVLVSYRTTDSNTSVDGVTGDGEILYSSGSWTISVRSTETSKPVITANTPITVSYSYYTSSSSITYTGIDTTKFDSTKVTAVTISQSGQNLSISLNNGIVMSGKFTNVQQTGKINQDTNAGYNTYNAQFQVQANGTKMVGSLNYDLQSGYRVLNGTWTWGKRSWDVQAVGPAWLNSADASTLSAGVQQSQK